MKTTEPPVVVEQFFNVPIHTVWNAITNVDEMTQWFFDNIPDFKAEVGFTTQFNVKAPSRDFMHVWKVTEVITNKKLTYNWTYEGLEGDSFVTFELSPEQNNTKLVLSTNVVEDFDDEIPEFKRESCEAGWNYFIKERLKLYLMP